MSNTCRRLPISRPTVLALGGCLALSSALAPLAGSAQSYVTVIVNGQRMSFDQPPILKNGRVFVPLRGIFEQLGASVVYANGQINATKGRTTVSLTIGSNQAVVNGQSTTLDVAPFIVGARTLVPLRFIAQSLGATVNWNDSTSTVTINGGGQPAPAPTQSRATNLTYQWPTGTIFNHFPQVRFQIDRPLKIGSFTILLDGRDITAGVQNNGQYFYVPVSTSLPMGNHRVRVIGRTVGGLNFDLTWTFNQGSY